MKKIILLSALYLICAISTNSIAQENIPSSSRSKAAILRVTPQLEKDFADKNSVRATPAMDFYDPMGNLMQRYTGAARNVQEFMWLGEFVVDEHYKTTKFAVYKRQKKKQGM